MSTISPREALANKIAEWLADKTSAPHGVLNSKDTKRNCRTITFGVARYLDATIQIYGPKYFLLRGIGKLASNAGITGGIVIRSEEDLFDALKTLLVIK